MLDINQKHKVVVSDDYIDTDERGQQHQYCYVDGHKRYIKKDYRGKKSKFWIQNKARTKYAYLLKYEERRNDSMDNVGQFIMCGILEQLGVPHANYLVSVFEKNEQGFDSIISESYKKSPYEVEISGYGLNMKYLDREYDNNLGEKPAQHHTVNFYMSVLNKLYGKHNFDYDGIRNQLLQYALLQYVFVMSDLHYYNLSFSFDELLGRKSMKVIPFYDCGNICSLSVSKRKVKNIYEQMSGSRKKNIFVDSLIHRKMPMFGIETDLSTILREEGKDSYVCRPICNQETNNRDIDIVAQGYLDIFREELAHEILFNPELHRFYEKIKKDVDIKKVSEHYNGIKAGTIPYYCADLVQMTMESTISSLEKTLKQQRKKLCSVAEATVDEITPVAEEKEVVKC